MAMTNTSQLERREGNDVRTETDPLVFIHVPKAGGSTLKEVIFRQYPRGTALWISFQRPEMMSAFLEMSAAERAKLNCLMGHIPYGFHTELPAQAFLFTMLREPVSRFLSEYQYMLRYDRTGAWRPPGEAMDTLQAFLDYRIRTNAMEVQTGMISGFFPGVGAQPPFDPLPEGALERAKANLRDHFGLVGVTDRFDETMLLLKKRMNWKHGVHYARRNAAPRKSSSHSVDPALLERIREHTQNDAALVAYAGELLDQALAEQDPSFMEELAALKRRNHRIYMLTEAWKETPLLQVFSVPGLRQVRRLAGKVVHRFC
jgi:hypothetical protein